MNKTQNSENELTMARYGITADLGGTVSPVILDVEFFNSNIMYQAGVFIITDPGYYRLTVQFAFKID